MNELDYRIASDRGILVKFGNEISEQTFNRVSTFEKNLLKDDLPGILETIRSFCTLFISYDPSKTDYETLIYYLKKLEQIMPSGDLLFTESKIIEIPVVYGGEYGPDLPSVAELLNISEEDVIQQHLSHDYLVYITAFLAGLPMFKGKGKLFDLPRKKTPVICPQGAVILANGMGCVFNPIDTPSGWYGIGRSPLRQWYPDRDPPVLIKSGDRIKYKRIDENAFYKIKQEVDQKTYKLMNIINSSYVERR